MNNTKKEFLYIEEQHSTALKIIELFKTYDNVILEAPTGKGKSAIAYLVQKYLKKQTIVLMHQKILQDQYEEFFDGDKAVSIKGKDNYLCSISPGSTVKNAPCQHKFACFAKASCHYYKQVEKFRTADFKITNYAYYFSIIDTLKSGKNEGLVDSYLAIYDEAHNIRNIFIDYRALSIGTSDIERYKKFKDQHKSLGDEVKKLYYSIDSVIKKINTFKDRFYEDSFETIFKYKGFLINELNAYLSQEKFEKLLEKDPNDPQIRDFSNLLKFEKDCMCKYSNYKDFGENTKFIFDKNEFNGSVEYILKPLNIDMMFPEVVNQFAEKKLFMSAFMEETNIFMKNLGLQEERTIRINLDSDFPLDNRMIYFANSAHINNTVLNNKEDFSIITEVIETITEQHAKRGESGVIFTNSYKVSNLIKTASQDLFEDQGYELLVNQNASERDFTIHTFRNSPNQKQLLISPSFFEGVNFEDDISRFQIIVKVPFEYLGSNYGRAKLNKYKQTYEQEALMKILQSSGRSVRHPKDYCRTYILDKNATRLYRKYKKIIPDWFKKAIIIL